MSWLSLRRVGAVNLLKLTFAYQVIYSIISSVAGFALGFTVVSLFPQLVDQGVVDPTQYTLGGFASQLGNTLALSVAVGLAIALVFAATFNFVCTLGFVDGFHAFIDKGKQATSSTGRQWVSWRRQGAMNTAKLASLSGLLLGIPLGLLAFALSIFAGYLNTDPSYGGFLNLLGLSSIILVPLGLGILGFILGVLQAALGNFSRQLSFVNGIHLQVQGPLDGKLGWVKVYRLGTINYAKYSAVQSAVIGAFLGIAATVLLWGDFGAYSLLLIPGSFAFFLVAGGVFGAVQAFVYNFILGLKEIDGLHLQLAATAGAAPTGTPLAGKARPRKKKA